MLFSSMEFLLLFFPVVYGVYFFLPLKLRNYWLLITSLFFYAWGEPVFVLIMIGSIVVNYILALRIDELRESRAGKRVMLILSLIVNLGMLGIFKYLNFITATLHAWIPGTESLFPQTSIALPIGISFFTFQALSYVIDVYRGDVPAQRNIGYLGLYISMFPQLIAGPIVRYSTIMDQITDRKVTVSSFSQGMLRFMTGFSKKILLANVLAEVADYAFSKAHNSALMAWLGALSYALQIFFDFCGYSDMAIGLGRMLGFDFLENFDYPYISRTITEFWRRWHISLGTWFRDYVYFPMGGSRVKSRARLILNLMVVWLLTGIWHGADWTFILWGLLYGVAIVVEKLLNIPKRRENWRVPFRVISRIITLLLILFGWVLFRAESLTDARKYFLCMFGKYGWVGEDFLFYGREYIVYLVVGIICSTPVFKVLKEKIGSRGPKWKASVECIGAVVQILLFFTSFTMLVMNAHNPFIYFNF